MKNLINLILIAILGITLLSCETNKTNTSQAVSKIPDESTYLKDRRLEKSSTLRTNSHGASGPGVGAGYASGSYRQNAIKEKSDSKKDVVKESPGIPGRNSLAADTADEGRSW